MKYENAKFFLPPLKTFRDEKIRYRNEIRLLKGYNLKKNKKQSILLFTTHKCASTYMMKCMNYLNHKYFNLITIDMERYLWNYSSVELYEAFEQKKGLIFYPQGFMYSPLRKYFKIENIEKYSIVLMLRDPRDVIVSHYYSIKYSHGLPLDAGNKTSFIESRIKAETQTIDEYALKITDRFYKTYIDYYNYLIKQQDIKVLLYRDFVTNFPSWLNQLGEQLNINFDKKDLSYLTKIKGDNKNIKENKFNHIRKAEPGDYQTKLKLETQYFLNNKFQDVLYLFN